MRIMRLGEEIMQRFGDNWTDAVRDWTAAGGDSRFLYELRCEWVRGILDIISPRVDFHPASAIER